jgi:Helix-turn-helix domain
MGKAIKIELTDKERVELRAIVGRRSESAGLVRRARVVLPSDAGVAGREIALRLDLTPEHVSVIRARFRAEGVAGLAERPKAGRKDHAASAATEARLVEMAMSPPPAGAHPLDDAAAGQAGGPFRGVRIERAAAQRAW